MAKYDNSTTANDGGTLRAVRVNELKQGTFFKRKVDSDAVYVRGEYDKTLRRFFCERHGSTGNSRVRYADLLLNGSAIVYIGFAY